MKPDPKVLTHFQKRSASYNASSRWVVDEKLLDLIFETAAIKGGETVLDIATGTGLVARRFKGRAGQVIGLDISSDMTKQAAAHVDRMIIGPVEEIPLPAGSVDVCVCRQGLQFVDLPRAIPEIARVLRPGGRAVLCHLTSYGDEDAAEAFKIQALRNPSRVNFFKPGDLEARLEQGGLFVLKSRRYLSRESVRGWIEHGAIDDKQQAAIFAAYRGASAVFKRLHSLEEAGGDVLDVMPFSIIEARKGDGRAGR